MKYLVDASVIAEVRKGALCDGELARWWANVGDDLIYLSVLTLGEIRRDVERTRMRSPERAAAMERWLTELRRLVDHRVLGVDHRVADAWGRISATSDVTLQHGLHAATAEVHRMTLVSHDEASGVAFAPRAHRFNPAPRARRRAHRART